MFPPQMNCMKVIDKHSGVQLGGRGRASTPCSKNQYALQNNNENKEMILLKWNGNGECDRFYTAGSLKT